MWRTIRNIAQGMRTIMKYAGLITVIIEILGFASGKLEKYAEDTGSKDDVKE